MISFLLVNSKAHLYSNVFIFKAIFSTLYVHVWVTSVHCMYMYGLLQYTVCTCMGYFSTLYVHVWVTSVYYMYMYGLLASSFLQ